MEPPIRVLIVEDQLAILRAQRRLLETAPGLEVVGAATTGEEALPLIDTLAPQVLLCDLGLPGIDGVEVTRRARRRPSPPEILIFTVFEEEERVLAAIQAGAAGYLLKGTPLPRLVEAIHDVHLGGTVIQPSLARTLLRHFRADALPWDAPPAPDAPRLTPREQEVLALIAKGLTNPEVASVLGCSRSTIRTHLEHIYEKLEATNRVEAVTEGLRHGLIGR
jgi:DNA-binding NarL/FixJ family response regulator